MQILISVFLLASFFKTNAQTHWNLSSPLTWNNFKGSPPTGNFNFRANTFSEVNCQYGRSDTCIFYVIETRFIEDKSWYIDSSKELLEHEKGHFNISEIYARKIRKYLFSILRKSVSDEEIEKEIDKLQQLKIRYQTLYDTETNFSRNLNQQKRWALKISVQLKQLDKFKSSTFYSCPSLDE